MKIHKGDNVTVVTGKDRGKTGKVLVVLPRAGRIIVENVNVMKRHQRSRRANQKGQIIEKPLPMDASNVMIVDPESGRPARIGYKFINDKKVRVIRKSGREI